MTKYAQLVVGPAGVGKSTYCHTVQEHCASVKRNVHVVNLDPAAERFKYQGTEDVRELVTVEDAMEEMELGPNGALVFCMEYLEDNLEEWLGPIVESFAEDDYVLFDCPGQVELYTHLTVFKTIVQQLQNWGFQVCAVYLLDAQYLNDVTKFIAGTLTALSTMVQLELPHVNVVTKMDLVQNKLEIESFLDADAQSLLYFLNRDMSPSYARLNAALAQVADEYGMVTFATLDPTDEESVADLLQQVDHAIQYGEDLEVQTTYDG